MRLRTYGTLRREFRGIADVYEYEIDTLHGPQFDLTSRRFQAFI